jgi:hypothetical protein
LKKTIAVLAVVAGSVFLAAPAAVADGVVPDTEVTATPEPTDTPTDTPSDTPTETPAKKPADPPGRKPAVPEATSGLTDAKLVAAAPEKVVICHATDAQNHPYVVNKPAKDGDVSGHADHTGPVWHDGIEPKWGDIIPPFDYPGGSFPGLNWNAEGQAIYDNGCKIPDEVVTTVTPQAPTTTPATCDEDGTLVLPTTTGVEYVVDPLEAGPGDYTVTALPLPGYVLAGTEEFAVTVDAKLTGDECDDPEEDSLLPDTGGSPLWLLMVAGSMIAVGVILVSKRQAVVPSHRLQR